MIYKDLTPTAVWTYFNEINQIPRPSKKEGKMIEYLLNFAKSHALDAEFDSFGNVIIRKPASPGMENAKPVILQSHSDMVCEKNAETAHDFDNDPIQTYIEDGWVKAKGTTLGADDGIGVAATLAVLAADNLAHGPIEALITADEETGMTGAFGLSDKALTAKTLINLDSEDEGELYIGCAGGMDTVFEIPYKRKSVKGNVSAYKISVTGLKGGHSGDEIHKGLGNANKILTRLILHAQNIFDVRLADFNGGNLRNAIPREAFGVVVVDKKYRKSLLRFVEQQSEYIKNELALVDNGLTVSIEKTEQPDYVVDRFTQFALINALQACWHGVFAMSAAIPGLVETSTNLASVKFEGKNKIVVTTSQRSSVDSAKRNMAQTVASVFELTGADIKYGKGYPGWQPNPDSDILRVTSAAYQKLFGTEAKIKAIHAGLECGLFLEKYPEMDMISIGPTVKGAHSPDERLNIESVQKFWDLLVEVLAKA